MAGQTPGPMCQVENHIDLDSGTMCCIATPTPGPVCGSTGEIRGPLCWAGTSDPKGTAADPKPKLRVELDPATDFEEGTAATSPSAAQADPMWVENDILNYFLSDKEPWTFTILYGDGTALMLPLTAMWFGPIGGGGGTITLFRRHKHSGRIIPFQASQSDPKLKDPKLKGMSIQQALPLIATPRFDTKLTPTLLAYVNEAQMIFMAIGFLKVAQLSLANPLTLEVGWAARAAVSTSAREALTKLAVRRLALTTAKEVAPIGERLAAESMAAGGTRFQQYLEFARRLGTTSGLSPQAKANLLESFAARFGLDVGGQAMKEGGRILLLAKDGRSAFQILADGSVSFGRFNLKTLDIVDPQIIRALKGP